MWRDMVPCYDHVITMVNAEGDQFVDAFRVVRHARDTGF